MINENIVFFISSTISSQQRQNQFRDSCSRDLIEEVQFSKFRLQFYLPSFREKIKFDGKNLSHLSRSRPLDIVERVLFVSAYILRVQIDIHCVPRFYTPISYCVYFIIILPYAFIIISPNSLERPIYT